MLRIFQQEKHPLADFYSGIIHSTLGMNIKHELRECMVEDAELNQVWDKAIWELSTGMKTEWKEHFQLAMKMSPKDLASCKGNYKLQVADEQLHKAGKQFGHMWNKILGGRPKWAAVDKKEETVAEPEEVTVVAEDGFPLADFSAAYLKELYGIDFFEEINECLIKDDIEFATYNALFDNLKPYDDFNYQKYIRAIGVMDDYNWSKCAKGDELGPLLASFDTWMNDFWSAPDVSFVLAKNLEGHMKELLQTQSNIQESWAAGLYDQAGEQYAYMYEFMMGGKPPAPTAEADEKVLPTEADYDAFDLDSVAFMQ